MLRLEHDFAPAVTLRNQTRYNRHEREAVITSIANPAAYNPATNLVTLSRQANERHERHLLESDQPDGSRLDRQVSATTSAPDWRSRARASSRRR